MTDGCRGLIQMHLSDRYAHSQLGAGQREWLDKLPTTANVEGGILAFHASPDDDNCYGLEAVSPWSEPRGSGSSKVSAVPRPASSSAAIATCPKSSSCRAGR
jgi:hypothetical protein